MNDIHHLRIDQAPTSEAERIWRALEATSERITAAEERDENFRHELPGLLRDAVAAGVAQAVDDPARCQSFWQSGLEHFASAGKKQAGAAVLSLLWSGLTKGALLVLLLIAFGPAALKVWILDWWHK